MEYTNKPPKWDAAGTEPSADLQANGFTAGYKPPAAYFNYLFHAYTECIKELQAKAGTQIAAGVEANTDLNDCTTVGMYTFSLSDAATIANIPAQAQGTMFVLPRLINGDTENLMQIIVTQTNTVYIRNKIDGTWNEWRKLFKNDDTIPITNGGTGAKTAEAARKNLGVNYQTFHSLSEIGLTNGSETIETIANALPSNSELICSIVAENADIYPTGKLGLLRVTKADTSRIKFAWTQKENGVEYFGTYSVSSSTPWTGWKKMMDEKPPFVELHPNTGSTTGGYIDFHYGNADEDYTSRIIEDALGHLRIIAQNGILVPSIDPTIKSLRNIYAGTADMTAGTTTLDSGAIYMEYE